MEQGQITLDRRRTTEWIGNGVRFFLAAALTASQTAGGYAPFALGMAAEGAEGETAAQLMEALGVDVVGGSAQRQAFVERMLQAANSLLTGEKVPPKGADEGKILPLISQKSKIFASFSPGRSFCACGAKRALNPNLYHHITKNGGGKANG